MKQSSIDWLIENLTMVYPRIQEMGLLVDKAKWMHKEEHRKTFNQGLMSNFQNFDDYYNETFNTKEK